MGFFSLQKENIYRLINLTKIEIEAVMFIELEKYYLNLFRSEMKKAISAPPLSIHYLIRYWKRSQMGKYWGWGPLGACQVLPGLLPPSEDRCQYALLGTGSHRHQRRKRGTQVCHRLFHPRHHCRDPTARSVCLLRFGSHG